MKIPSQILAAAGVAGALALCMAGLAQISSLQAADSSAAEAAMPAGMVRGTVLETMEGGGYTYVRIDMGAEERWIASRQATVAVGDEVLSTEGMPMADFTSPSLGRSFALIYFSDTLQNLSAQGEQGALPHPVMPEGHPPTQMPPGHPDLGGGAVAPQVDTVVAVDAVVAALEPGRDIAYVYAHRNELAGQAVSLRGKVVKYNEAIMGRNWIHLQDGSGNAAAGEHDLLVTTQGAAAVGDTVVVTGNLVLDKDFGSGYRFPVLLEDAVVANP